MATPKLKTAGAPAAPTRLLRPSGAAPAKQIKLKSATGKTIEPKKAPTPKPVASTPAPEEEAITPQPVAEVAPEPIEETPVTPVPEIIAAEETPVEEAPAETAAETADADAEALRLAQEEYERQMEEYNRQMEEYNRQMAALQAAEAAAAPEAAEESPADPAPEAEPATAPAKKKKKPAAAPATEAPAAEADTAAPAPAKKKKKAAPALSEEEMAEVQARLAEEQKQPIWKTVPFMVGCGLLVVTIGICTTMVVQKQAEDARIQAHIDYTNSLLRRAQEINMKQVESMADANKKGVDVTCTMEDAKALMEVVVDPFVKGENGKPRYGARAEGVAQNACLLLGLAAEQNEAIRDMIFDTMGKKCNIIKPGLFHWLLQRVAISDAKGVNASLKKLSKVVAEKQTAKPWNQKTQYLANIWECIGLRVTESDVKEIIDLLKSDIADNTLAGNLCICLDNILTMMDDEAAKAKVGDEIFNTMPEKLRDNTAIAGTLGRACSTAALAFYKKELESSKNWSGAGVVFIGCWGNDDILDYVLEQKNANSDNPKALSNIEGTIGTILKQDRPRSQAMADKLLSLCFENPYGDTSGLQAIIFKTDPDSVEYIGDSNPELETLKARQKELENLRKQKERIIKVLATLSDHEWVLNTLNKYKADKDENIQYEAGQALEKVHANAINAAKTREGYKARSKD